MERSGSGPPGAVGERSGGGCERSGGGCERSPPSGALPPHHHAPPIAVPVTTRRTALDHAAGGLQGGGLQGWPGVAPGWLYGPAFVRHGWR
jgi:hypothetical protein